jgi:hypothetical protein
MSCLELLKTSMNNGYGGLGSSVGIATGYGLDGPGIESRWGEIFRLSRPALGPSQPPVQWVHTSTIWRKRSVLSVTSGGTCNNYEVLKC